MAGPPFLEVIEVKGGVLLASNYYRKSCLGTPRGSEQHLEIGCPGDRAHNFLGDSRWAEMGVCSKLCLRLLFRSGVTGHMSGRSRRE